VLIISNLSVKF